MKTSWKTGITVLGANYRHLADTVVAAGTEWLQFRAPPRISYESPPAASSRASAPTLGSRERERERCRRASGGGGASFHASLCSFLPSPPSLLLPLPVSLLYTHSLSPWQARASCAWTSARPQVPRCAHPPKRQRNPRTIPGIQDQRQRECTVGTWVGATVGRGGTK